MAKNSFYIQMIINNNFQMFKQIHLPIRYLTRQCSTERRVKVKPKVTLDENINELMKQDVLKPRKHEGKVPKATVELPKWIIAAMKHALEDYPMSTISKDAADLHRYFNSKMPPPEKHLTEAKYQEIRESVEEKMNCDNITESMDKKIHNEAMKILKRAINPWSPIEYDKYRSLMYMLARGSQDYAILYKIMSEIKLRDPTFKPKSLLDFGSGIGTVSWAANELWHSSLKERVCIDISTDMIDLAEKLTNFPDSKLKNVAFHRHYLPIGSGVTHDIVVSSFSLLELPSRKMRIETLSSLWRKTEKYLILVEYGTKGGFQIISEARDYLRHLINLQKERDSKHQGFILSPCPHDSDCPKFTAGVHACTFEAKYFKLTFDKGLIAQKERYTYVVFKKGSEREEKDKWPRLVRPVLLRSRHAICRMCTPSGELKEIIFSKGKHERPLYRCARCSKWGDRLPVGIDINKEE